MSDMEVKNNTSEWKDITALVRSVTKNEMELGEMVAVDNFTLQSKYIDDF